VISIFIENMTVIAEAARGHQEGSVGLAQPSAVQASLQRYRLHFGNPEISLIRHIFSCTGFTIGGFHYTIGVFISISIGYFP
jgi:hypothetical protein